MAEVQQKKQGQELQSNAPEEFAALEGPRGFGHSKVNIPTAPVRLEEVLRPGTVPESELLRTLTRGTRYSYQRDGQLVTVEVNGSSPATSVAHLREHMLKLGPLGSKENPVNVEATKSDPAYAAYVKSKTNQQAFSNSQQELTSTAPPGGSASPQIQPRLTPLPTIVSVRNLKENSTFQNYGGQNLLSVPLTVAGSYVSGTATRPNPGACYRMMNGLETSAGQLNAQEDGIIGAHASSNPNQVVNMVLRNPSLANQAFGRSYTMVTATTPQEVEKLEKILQNAPPGSFYYTYVPGGAGHVVQKREDGTFITGHSHANPRVVAVDFPNPYTPGRVTSSVLMIPKKLDGSGIHAGEVQVADRRP